MSSFGLYIPFVKINDELREVTGWASVTSKGGEPVVDLHGDIIELADLREAVYEFLDSARDAGFMHYKADGRIIPIGKVTGSLIVDSDVAKALGMDTDQEGWVIQVKVEDDEVWNAVKAGLLTDFSIGGQGVREEA